MLILTRRIGETLMIGNDISATVLGVKGNQVRIGINAPKEVSGEIALGQGWHPFELCYFQAGGGKVLDLKYSADQIEKQSIPKEKLASFSSGMKMLKMN